MGQSVTPNMTPLLIAVASGQMEGVKLIKYIAPTSIDITDCYGRSAIFYAVKGKAFEILDFLLSKPTAANPNIQTKVKIIPENGEYPLHSGSSALHYIALVSGKEYFQRMLIAGK